MNLAEAIDWVEQAIEPLQVGTQEIVRLLALENDRLSRELRVPLIRGTAPSNAAFLSAATHRPERLIQVWDSAGVRVPVWSIEEAYRRYPNWVTSTTGPKFVVYDPTTPATVLIPKHFLTVPSVENLAYLVASRPSALVLDADEIWTATGGTGGQLPEYHELVPKKVSSDLLLGYNNKIQDQATLSSLIRRGELYREEVGKGIESVSALRSFTPVTVAR